MGVYGCLTFIFYQKKFYDKMDLRLFFFSRDNILKWIRHSPLGHFTASNLISSSEFSEGSKIIL